MLSLSVKVPIWRGVHDAKSAQARAEGRALSLRRRAAIDRARAELDMSLSRVRDTLRRLALYRPYPRNLIWFDGAIEKDPREGPSPGCRGAIRLHPWGRKHPAIVLWRTRLPPKIFDRIHHRQRSALPREGGRHLPHRGRRRSGPRWRQ